MKKLYLQGYVVAVFLAVSSSLLQAQEPLPYRATFEAENGFDTGDVHGQHGFSVVRGEAEVLSDVGVDGSAGLKLHPSRPFGIVQLSIDANLDVLEHLDKVIHTDFHIRPGAVQVAEGDQFIDVEGSLSGFFKIDDVGELHLYDGGGGGEAFGQWLPDRCALCSGRGGERQELDPSVISSGF